MTLASRPRLTPPAVTGLRSGGGSLAYLPPDIIRIHILPCLDGPTLASAACASSMLRAICSSDELWQAICATTWPSTATDPALRHVISTFRAGFKSFYSDAYFLPHSPTRIPLVKLIAPIPPLCGPAQTLPTKLVSAIDVFYGGELVFSKVKETETASPPFMSAPFRIILNTSIPIPLLGPDSPIARKNLQENLRVSWVIVDPARKRALSLTGPGSVWISGSSIHQLIWARFSSVIRFGLCRTELAACHVYVTCKSMAAGVMKIKGLCLTMEGERVNELTGKDSLVILASAMAGLRQWRPEGTRAAVKDVRRELKNAKQWGEVITNVKFYLVFFLFVVTLYRLFPTPLGPSTDKS